MISLSRLSFLVGMLGFVSGLRGFRRILVLGRMLGLGLISFPLLLFLLSRILRFSLLISWLNLILLMLSSTRPGWLFFCRSGHPVITPDQFLGSIGHLLLQENYLDLPRITGRDLQEVARAKKITAGGLGGLGMKLRLFRFLGFLILLFFWS